MTSIKGLLAELDEKVIAKAVIHHDEARMQYVPRTNTVSDFDDFSDIIGDYYNYHFTRCVSRGGNFPRVEAVGQAKEIISQEYRKRNDDITAAFNDAQYGTNGGLRHILDIICERLKARSVEQYIRDVFDRYVKPSSPEDKMEIIRQFVNQCGSEFSSSLQTDRYDYYAKNYEELIRSYVTGLQRTSTIFRRL